MTGTFSVELPLAALKAKLLKDYYILDNDYEIWYNSSLGSIILEPKEWYEARNEASAV